MESGDQTEITGRRAPTRKPHVVVIPYPSQGHINPLLQFAKRLSSYGIKATYAGAISDPIAVHPVPDFFGSSSSSPSVGHESDFLSSLRSNGSKSLSELIASHAGTDSPVCCVVYDAFLPWILDVARLHGVRGAAFFTNSATVSALFRLVHAGKLTVPLEVEDVRRHVPGVTPLWEARDLPSFLTRPDTYPAYLDMKLSQFGNLEFADWVFCNSFDDLESEVLKGIVPEQWPAKLIGPMVPSAYLDNSIKDDKGYGASLGQQCERWLDSKPPKSVVYISFGSIAALSRKQAAEIAGALQDRKLPFLWVVRESQLSTLPDGFLDYSKTIGMVVTWCNQLEVLAHPSVGCFMTHCGWNSTLEGLCLGVPMVGVPQWTDQLTDAKFVSEVWRVGVWAREGGDGVVGRAEIGAYLEEVMVDGKARDEIAKNAVKWKELAKNAVTQGGTSANHILEFTQQLIQIDQLVIHSSD